MHLSNLGTVFLGAPEMLLQENPAAVVEAQARGSRVLVLAHSSELISMQELKLPENLEGIAVIEITDPIREGASDTLEYLRSQGVDLKIISGDNPVTVSYIAQQAGFKNYENYIDCSKISDDQLAVSYTHLDVYKRQVESYRLTGNDVFFAFEDHTRSLKEGRERSELVPSADQIPKVAT